MIERDKFDNLMATLAMFFDPPTDESIKEYYEVFKNENISMIENAIPILISTYSYRKFPLPADIFQAMQEAQRGPSTIDNLPGCDECGKTGIKLVEQLFAPEDRQSKGEMRMVAAPCNCGKGRRIKLAWESTKAKERRKMIYRG